METQKWPSHNPLNAENRSEIADEFRQNGSSFSNLLENDKVERTGNNHNKNNHIKIDPHMNNLPETAISEKSRKVIDKILEDVKNLTPVELLFLYLKLPTECSNSTDPLQKPLNPLGSRSEINQTIMWIKTHLEEDPELSLPKQDVYEEYRHFCEPNKIKPLSTADFGKVMKQVYANVRPRRLGTRGNSRYCYAGLRRRFKLEFPNLPNLVDNPQSTEPSYTSADLFAAAWAIVKEWTESQLGTQFPSLHVLAAYLVLNGLVGHGNAASTIITSITKCQLKGNVSPSTNSNCSNKHKETQLQLQRKIQQKNDGKECKRKNSTESKSRSKKCKIQNHQVSTSSSNGNGSSSTTTSTNASPISAMAVNSDCSQSKHEGLSSVCDKSLALPDFRSLQKSVVEMGATSNKMCDNVEKTLKSESAVRMDESNFNAAKDNHLAKVAIPRVSSSVSKVSPVETPTKRAKNAKYKMIQPKSEPCDIASYNPQAGFGSADNRSQNILSGDQSARKNCGRRLKKLTNDKFQPPEVKSEEKIEQLSSVEFPITRERLISVSQVDKDALDDYLGTNNSQEHEEELMKYFENEHLQQEQTSKLSQLRQLLEKNGHHANKQDSSDVRINLISLLNSSNQSAFTKTSATKDTMIPSLPAFSGQQTSVRRRVSFETVTTSRVEETVPASPSTRRKNFSFVPISPGPVSPGGGLQSKSSSATASPFISPRNTPVPRAKNQCSAGSFVSGLPSASTVQKNKNLSTGKLPLKIKQEVEFNLNTEKQLSIATNIPNYMPMSAPPSPKVKSKATSNLLQQLLNSKGRISYVHGSNNSMLCTEVSQLLTGNPSVTTSEVGFRSQSVPLHQMSLKSELNLTSPLASNSCSAQFSFNVDNTASSVNNTPIPNEFNDFDTFSSGAENINVNKILNELENDNNVVPISESEFGNINLDLSIGRDSFGLEYMPETTQSGADLNSNLKVAVNPNPLDIESSLKYNPSRSVPGTPLPYGNEKQEIVKNYRSYPSTPLATTEMFTYTIGHDYLLNGQPVKEKIEENIDANFLPNPGDNQDIYQFNVTDTGMLLGDNKSEFNFEGQLSEDSFGAKNDPNPILGDNCVIINYGFRNAIE